CVLILKIRIPFPSILDMRGKVHNERAKPRDTRFRQYYTIVVPWLLARPLATADGRTRTCFRQGVLTSRGRGCCELCKLFATQGSPTNQSAIDICLGHDLGDGIGLD